jgi:hypothetical protein
VCCYLDNVVGYNELVSALLLSLWCLLEEGRGCGMELGLRSVG